MDNYKELFSVGAIILGFIGLVPYFWGIYKGTAKPHMFSWMIWCVVSGIAGYIQLTENAGAGSWFLIVNAGFCACIATAAYWRGTKDIRRSDWVVLFVALSSIPLWVITSNPLWSVLLVVGIDAIGYLPTIRKSWHRPYEEPAFPWGLSVIVFSLSFLALESYSVTTYIYPVTFIIINIFFVTYLLVRRKIVT